MKELLAEQSDAALSAAPPSRCDNYEEYLADEMGYAWNARDVVAMSTLERHDELAAASAEELEQEDFSELNDFLRWAVARRWAQLGHVERFAVAVNNLLESMEPSALLQYHEIYLTSARLLADADHHDQALALLERYSSIGPEDASPALRLRAVIHLGRDDIEAGEDVLAELRETFGQQPEVCFEVAETLAGAGYTERAAEWLKRARAAAEEVGDRPILVDIELLEGRLTPE